MITAEKRNNGAFNQGCLKVCEPRVQFVSVQINNLTYVIVCECFSFLFFQWDVSRPALASCEEMRPRGGRDFSPNSNLELARPPPPVTWLPGVLGKGVRLRLRLHRRYDGGRGCWQLVDLKAESEPGGWRMRTHKVRDDSNSIQSALTLQ